MFHFLHAQDLVFSYGEQVLFDGISFKATAGQRLGLIGENGTGKSTLLRLLAGAETPHAGSIERGADVGFLAQELPFPDTARFSEVIDNALSEIRSASAELDSLTERLGAYPEDTTAMERYGRVLEWAQAHDLWDADRRAELVCIGLGLSKISPHRQVSSLSGGERARLGLAALLIRQPEIMLLDEPTNHLDDAGLDFLERYLRELTGTIVFASHDRVFLNAVCTDILDLDPSMGGLTRYGGSYSDYLRHKRIERVQWEQRFAEEQDELQELRNSVTVTSRAVAHNRPPRDNAKMLYDFKTGRVQKQISRRVRNAQLRLDELLRDQVRKPPAPLRFNGEVTSAAGTQKLLLSIRKVEVPQRLYLEQLDVTTSTRLLITGENGAGKSTLLSVLAVHMPPESGTVSAARSTRIGLLEQEVSFADPSKSANEVYAESAPEALVTLSQLGLLAPRDAIKSVGSLSVGQRRRLALAILLAEPPDILLLDEPTNHISLTLAEELFAALETSPGAVIIASHDRWLRRTWNGEQLNLAGGRVSS